MKYRKKPVVIDAVQWRDKNLDEVKAFAGDAVGEVYNGGTNLIIYTLEGAMVASTNDFIVRGVNGEFYPCKPYIFEKTYEPIGSEE